MPMEHLVVSVLADGSVQVDGPSPPGFLETLDRYFDAMGITSPHEKAAEIIRMAPGAKKATTQ